MPCTEILAFFSPQLKSVRLRWSTVDKDDCEMVARVRKCGGLPNIVSKSIGPWRVASSCGQDVYIVEGIMTRNGVMPMLRG